MRVDPEGSMIWLLTVLNRGHYCVFCVCSVCKVTISFISTHLQHLQHMSDMPPKT